MYHHVYVPSASELVGPPCSQRKGKQILGPQEDLGAAPEVLVPTCTHTSLRHLSDTRQQAQAGPGRHLQSLRLMSCSLVMGSQCMDTFSIIIQDFLWHMWSASEGDEALMEMGEETCERIAPSNPGVVLWLLGVLVSGAVLSAGRWWLGRRLQFKAPVQQLVRQRVALPSSKNKCHRSQLPPITPVEEQERGVREQREQHEHSGVTLRCTTAGVAHHLQ